MAIEVETHIPRRIIVGNAYNFTAGDDDYPASSGWTAQIAFKIGNAVPITFNGVPDFSAATPIAVAISIASPGVITWTNHGLLVGQPVSFSTTGTLPIGLVAGTTYYIVNFTTNTFQVSATPGGSAINTSGTQSGIQSAIASGDDFLFTLTNANTATLLVGDNLVCVVFSDGTNREASDWREVEVLQNPLAADPVSYAQAQVTLLQSVITAFNTSSHNVVNFNGQSFTRGSVSEYQKQLTYYEARVMRENRAVEAQRGIAPRRVSGPSFANDRRWPFQHQHWGGEND
jgi:hypothetical protein